MPSFDHPPRGSEHTSDPLAALQRARDLYLVGGPDSDRQAIELLRSVFEQSKDASNRVPLDRVDSLPQLIHLLISNRANEEAGRWASVLLNSIEGNEQWLKRETLQDCYVWASKGLAYSGQYDAALKVEERFLAHIASRAASPGRAIAQSLYRSAVYHCQKGDKIQALIKATKASDEGFRFLQGSKEDTQMLFELLLFVRRLQEIEGAPRRDIQRTRHRITAATLRLSQFEGTSDSRNRGN